MPPQLEKNHVVPTSWQDEALARDGVSREVPCSALKGETVPESPRHTQCPLGGANSYQGIKKIGVLKSDVILGKPNLDDHAVFIHHETFYFKRIISLFQGVIPKNS